MNQTDATIVYSLEDSEAFEPQHPEYLNPDMHPKKEVKLQIFNKAAEEKTGVRFEDPVFLNN
jgi:hypothetical protein